MSLWFRMYSDVINDPKVLRLSDGIFRAWVTLLCIAAKHDGALPPTADIALMLRMKPSKVAEWITILVTAGLLDKTKTGFAPHNWSARQYKSDVSTERVKQFRKRQRNVSSDVSETPPEPEPETEDRIGDARDARALADALWRGLGIASPLQVPPDLYGADARAASWVSVGWPADMIEAEARRIGPGKPLTYYEKVFATAFAKRQAPLPVVVHQPGATIHETPCHRPESLGAIANRLADAGISFGPKPKLLDPRSRPALEPVPEG